MTFEWQGSLQGDPDTLDRSFFRLEIAKASAAAAGAQAEWTDLDSSWQTTPGEDAGSVPVGVPNAGDYRWRVCAWGVVDDLVDNAIEQLPGGCSNARSFGTTAKPASVGTIGMMEQRTTVKVDGATTVVEQERPAARSPAEPAGPRPVTTPRKLADPAFQPVTGRDTADHGTALALDSLDSESSASVERDGGGGLGGSVMSGLTATLPGIPIPFWTLAMLLACLPIAAAWRRDVLGMFDWPEEDEAADTGPGLQEVLVTSGVKDRSAATDGDATEDPGSDPARKRSAA